MVGMVGVVVGFVGDVGNDVLGSYALPLLAITLGVLGVFAWLGWIDYVSASGLAIEPRGVRVGGKWVAWSAVRSVTRATGSFRIALGTESGRVRFQLLVLGRPIAALKTLVAEATKAGAKVEPYLVRLAEHVEEDLDEPEP
jgi:hypothetical protein